MSFLVLGLVLFLGIHSVRMAAPGLRTQAIARLGQGAWKGLYALTSLVGLVLIVWGYGLARQQPVVLWLPPAGTRHAAALLMLAAFILFVAAKVPRNAIKAHLHHPMVLSVLVWALAHLIANGNLADVLLFGAFLVWAVLNFLSARQRDRAEGTVYAPGTAVGTATTVVVGAVAGFAFAFWGHAWLIGLPPVA
jgi:uncharacterized membrane protein